MNRIIPLLLLKGAGLYKGRRFRDHAYVGDPINTMRIFNGKDVDEIWLLNITASLGGEETRIDVVEKIAEECAMPFGVGGGIRTIDQIRRILQAGAEKVAVNTAALENPDLIREASESFGAQSIVVSIDVRRDWLGRPRVRSRCGTQREKRDPVAWAVEAERLGAGEILLTSIDRDGTGRGYDLPLVRDVSAAVRIPVVACGGAGTWGHLAEGVRAGASAAAAGSLFVFEGVHRAVLVQFPSYRERVEILASEKSA